MKTNVYILYGGKSVEHEVSLKSALAILNALDRNKFNVYPIYITQEGVWHNLGLLEHDMAATDDLIAIPCTSLAKSIGQFLINDFKEGEKNVIFPAIHGINGEDGTIQGFLELMDVPFVGNGVLSSAVAMDKVIMRDIFAKHNIPQTEYTHIMLHNWKRDENACYKLVEDRIASRTG